MLSSQNLTVSVFSCDCNALHVVFISWASILADINSNRAIESSFREQLSFCLPLTSHGPVHRLYVTQSKPSHSTLFYSPSPNSCKKHCHALFSRLIQTSIDFSLPRLRQIFNPFSPFPFNFVCQRFVPVNLATANFLKKNLHTNRHWTNEPKWVK